EASQDVDSEMFTTAVSAVSQHVEGGGVGGGAEVCEVGLRSVLERGGQGLAGPSAIKEVAEDRAEVAVRRGE
ncbi:hypothetical protein THAOC_20447, partial [Thalassiosira oceanica]